MCELTEISSISNISVADFSAFMDNKSMDKSDSPLQDVSMSGAIKFVAGEKIEVLENAQWQKARILEVDDAENEVLIGFGNSAKKQEWIPMSSSSIREIDFRPGDKCVLIKNGAFVTLKARLENGTYEIEYNHNGAKEIVMKDDLKNNELSLLVSIPVSKLPENLVNEKLKQHEEPVKKFEFYNSFITSKVRLAHDPSKSDKRKSNVVDCDLEHVSGIQWKNGVPIGEPMTIKVNNKDFSSYLIDDKFLPANWAKYVIRKKKRSQSDSQWKIIIANPEGTQFHNSRELRNYLLRYPSLNYNIKDFDFSIYPRKQQLQNESKRNTQIMKSLTLNSTKNFNYTVFKCPHINCKKQSRKLNLMQMHVRHYHPELKSYYASTPNVADLAYARTITSSKDTKEDNVEVSPKVRGSPRITPQPVKMSLAPQPITPVPDEVKMEVTDGKPDPVVIENVPGREDVIIVDGQIRKIVQMKPEEVINCFCNVVEEDGLMIQCELCCCWQHAYCNAFEKEEQIPDKYICLICINSFRMRESMRYFHDQDWMKDGAIPVFQDKQRSINLENHQELLRKSHDMYGNLLDVKEFLYSISVKINILENKNHPKLYLWSSKWTELNCENNDLELKTESIVEMDVIAPQPEARIDLNVCRLNLIEHIQQQHRKVNTRLMKIEADMDDLINLFEICTNIERSYLDKEDNIQACVEMLPQLINDFDTVVKLSKMILNKDETILEADKRKNV